MKIIFSAFVLVAMATTLNAADDLIDTGSANFAGEFKALEGGKVKFKTAFGMIEVPVADVRGLKIERPVEVIVGEGKPALGIVAADAKGFFDFGGRRMKLSDVLKISIPEPPVSEASRWSGSVGISLIMTDGNTNNTDFAGEFSLLRDQTGRQEDFRNKLSAYGRSFFGQTGDAVSRSRGGAGMQWDAFMDPKVGGFIAADWSCDYFAGVHARYSAGVGLSVIVADEEMVKANMQIGISYVGTHYNRWSLDASRAAGNDPREFDEYPSMLFKGDLLWKTTCGIEFGAKAGVFKSVTDRDKYTFDGEAWVSRAIGGGWALKASVAHRYSSPPGPGMKPGDTTCMLTLSVKF